MKQTSRNPWFWIPSLYFAEGLPYVVVMTVALIMYKRLGLSNTDIAYYTSWLYLPWVIKPFWSPLVDLIKTKRWWIVTMQLLIGAGLGGVALSLPLPVYVQATLIFFWLLAFSSATHDIAADGFYLHGLNEHQQTYFVGIRSTFYRIAMVTGQGILIILAGFFETSTGLPPIKVAIEVNPAVSDDFHLPQGGMSPSVDHSRTCFLLASDSIQLSTKLLTAEKADSILALVSTYNQTNGFEKSGVKKDSHKEKGGSHHGAVNAGSGSFSNFLRTHFGSGYEQANSISGVGNLAVAAVKLSSRPEPGKEMVLNMKFERGDNSINLIHGERLTFNAQNWDKPAYILFQADPKLKHSTYAIYGGTSGNIHLAWSITFFILAALFIVFALLHRIVLPYPVTDKTVRTGKNLLNDFLGTLGSFFMKKEIWVIIPFLLLYRFGEAQLIKMATPFMLDPRHLGGLGLTTGEVGLIYGTFGILALTFGGILGGLAAARKGFQYWLWWMVLAINLPHLAYVYLAMVQPENYFLIGMCVVVEQFSYGFGFTAYMLYMIYISEGEHKTAHFAIATAFMAMSMMVPGLFSGWLQEQIGYAHFFIWVMISMVPAVIPVFFIKVRKDFGRKK